MPQFTCEPTKFGPQARQDFEVLTLEELGEHPVAFNYLHPLFLEEPSLEMMFAGLSQNRDKALGREAVAMKGRSRYRIGTPV